MPGTALMVFGIGPAEILILCLIAVFLIGMPVAAVLIVLLLVRRQGGSRVADLEAENRRLREQLEQQRQQDPSSP